MTIRVPEKLFVMSSLLAAAIGAWSHCLALGQNANRDLGTTATAEELEGMRSGSWRSAEEQATPRPQSIKLDPIAMVDPAKPPIPMLRYRFRPWPSELTPGNGGVFFGRAVIHLSSIPSDDKENLDRFYLDYEDDELPLASDIGPALEPYASALQELDRMALCEEFEWDLRWRDLGLVDGLSLLLPEIQEARQLARVLRLRILQQLQDGDFEGAIRDIRTGYQLAAGIRTGESLIQQLVGISIEGLMQSCVVQAIRTPGCPSLYGALAVVHHDSAPIVRSIELESLALVDKIAVFREAKTANWNQDMWQRQWMETSKILSGFSEAYGTTSPPDFSTAVGLAGLIALRADIARKNLIEYGLPAREVEDMFPEQAVAIEAVYNLERVTHRMIVAATLQPDHADALYTSAMEELDRISKEVSPAGIFGGMMLPGVQQVSQAHWRNIARHNQLMTYEAIRNYAADNDGRLPDSLDELTTLPVLKNPFSGEFVEYEVVEKDGIQTGMLSLAIPNFPGDFYDIRFRISNRASSR